MKYRIILIMLCSIFLKADIPEQNQSPSPQTIQQFIMANYFQYNNETEQAAYWYEQLKKEKLGSAFFIGYLPYLEAQGKFDAIVNLIPILDKTMPNNLEIQTIIARTLERIGDKEQAYARLIKLNDLDKSNQEIAFKVTQGYLEHQEPENALKVIDSLLNTSTKKPNNFIFYFLKSQIYLNMGKKEDAYAAIKTCIELYPKFDKGWLLYGMLEEQAGKIQQALQGYATFLETTQEKHPEIEQHLIQLAVKQKLGASAAHPHRAKACVTQALIFCEKKQYRQALSFIDQCLTKTPHNQEAQLAKVHILVAQKHYTQALDELVRVSLASADNLLWLKTIHLLYNQGVPAADITRAYEHIAKRYSQDLNLWLYHADIQLREQRNHAAMTSLKKALALVKEPMLTERILYQLALLYYENHQFPSCYELLKKACDQNPSYPPLLNLIAYYYVEHNKDLTKAQECCTKALAYDPQNPHFLDTKALILYKQEKYQDALALLEPIAKQCPRDITIITHLSKTFYKIGKQDQALSLVTEAKKKAVSQHEKAALGSLISHWSNQKS